MLIDYFSKRLQPATTMVGHKYDLIVEDSEVKNEFRDEPEQPVATSFVTAWWKQLLCNLLAAFVGAGLTLVATRGFSIPQSNSSTSVALTQPAADLAMSTTTTTATVTETITQTIATTSTSIGTRTKTITADLSQSTENGEEIKALIPDPLADNPLAGQVLDCGYTPEDARAKGCVYDVMMQDWVPEPCYDAVLTERYLSQGNWTSTLR